MYFTLNGSDRYACRHSKSSYKKEKKTRARVI